MKSFFGLDLGSKTIGIAISLSGVIAQTYHTIRFKEDDYNDALNQLVPLIRAENISHIIIGLPKHMNNDLGVRGEITVKFAHQLKEKTNQEVILWDERLSTKTALKTMQGSSSKTRKQKKDELAAVLILQNYLDSIQK